MRVQQTEGALCHPTAPDRPKRDRASRAMGALLCALAAAVTLVAGQRVLQAQGPPRFGPGFGAPMMEQMKVVHQFDQDSDGRLNDAERHAARAWLATRRGPGGPGGRRGGGMGRGGVAASSVGRRIAPEDVPSAGRASLYDPNTLRTIFLQFHNADWEQELADFYNTDVDVPATVIMDGVTYRDVGVHFRGNSSYMMVPEGSKRSLNLAFTFAHDRQRLLGYRTINLLNANEDPSFLHTVLYMEIARHYIPAPQANYMRVTINGESWGVYVNAQQFNSDFTLEWFSSKKGTRWKVPGAPGAAGGMDYAGDSVDTYRRIYEIKSKDDDDAWVALIGMFRVLNQTPADKLETTLAPLLDIDGALKFLALEVVLANADGYWARASDYSIYRDDRSRFHVIPHDANESLTDERGPGRGGPRGVAFDGRGPGFPEPGIGRAVGGGPGGMPLMFRQAGADLDPLIGLDDARKPLRSRLLAVPALRAKYLRYVRDIADRWLDWKHLGPVAERYHMLIADDVKMDTRKLDTFEAFQLSLAGGDASLKGFVERRRAFLLKGKQ